MNISGLSLTSEVRSKEVWMDPALWGALPEPLVELVLVHIPLPHLLPMRAVCKKWNELLHSSAFLTAQRHRTVQCPAYVLTVTEPAFNAFAFFQTGPELYYLRSAALYCPASKNWIKDTNSCNLPLTPRLAITCSAPETLTYLRIVGDMVREKLTGGSHKSLPSSFNVLALVATLLAFPELRGVELVSLGMWGAPEGACAAEQPPSDEDELQSPHGRHPSDAS